MDEIRDQIEQAAQRAAVGCGQSDVMYFLKLQPRLQAILDKAPEHLKAQVLEEVTKHGYGTQSDEPRQEGQCALTGIDEHCCPCGRHP